MHKEYILMGGMALGEHWILFTHLVHYIIFQPGYTGVFNLLTYCCLVHHIIVPAWDTPIKLWSPSEGIV